MKRFIVITAAAALLSVTAFAQTAATNTTATKEVKTTTSEVKSDVKPAETVATGAEVVKPATDSKKK